MKGYFFDENLPSRLRFRPSLPLVPGIELGSSPTDTAVWEFARQQELVIVSKAAGRVASAPLAFCDARSGVLRAKPVADLAARGYLRVAIVDGSLASDEVTELEQVTAEWAVVVVAETTAGLA